MNDFTNMINKKKPVIVFLSTLLGTNNKLVEIGDLLSEGKK